MSVKQVCWQLIRTLMRGLLPIFHFWQSWYVNRQLVAAHQVPGAR